jgi:hypothetical protein
MKTNALAIVACIVLPPIASAQTGNDLLMRCISKDAIEQVACTLYIAGFVHGMQLGDELRGEICLPKNLTGMEATTVFVEALNEISSSSGTGQKIRPEDNPFLTGPQNAALAAALGMKFHCPQKEDEK